jgi:hypothetical protein
MRNRAFSLRSGKEGGPGLAAIIFGDAANHFHGNDSGNSGASSFQR